MSGLDEARGVGVTGEEFQNIKKERMAERKKNAEERRKHDLQRISEMKSRSGIEPLDQFPKEIWEAILEPLSPKDLGNTWNVHPTFQDILEERRVRDILFPQILNLKLTPFWKEPEGNQRQHEVDMTSVPLAEYPQLREVSKSLRNTIDQYHEEKILQNLLSQDEADVYSFSSFTFIFPENRKDKRKLDGILANFCSSGGGDGNKARRFFLRSLRLVIEIDDPEEVDYDHADYEAPGLDLMDAFNHYRNRITKLLEVVGEQVWRFECILSEMDDLEEDRGLPVSELYRSIVGWSKQMPNMKWIVLKNQCENSEEHIPENLYRDLAFPRLEHLERICVAIDTFDNANIFHMFKAVLTANQHVKVLSVIPGADKRNRNFFNYRLNPLLASLPSLALETYALNPEFLHSSWFGHLTPAINVNWQLKRLHLGGECNYYDMAWKSIFQLVEKFQTLEDLTLRVWDSYKFEEEISFLKLPNLTHLKLEVGYEYIADEYMIEFSPATNFIFSLQFLLYAKKLKKLEWRLELWKKAMKKLERFLVDRECSEKNINFRAGMRDLRSSNLWDLFPELENVKVELDANEKRKRCKVAYYKRGEKF